MPAFAQDNEELFTPYLVASLFPSGEKLVSESRSEVARLADGGSDQLSTVRTGVRLIKQGEYTKAITLLEPYRAEPDFLTLHALGVAYVRVQRNAEAYDVLLRAHKLNPGVAGPLLPAALACARIAKRCDQHRDLALEYLALGGKFKKFAEKIANYFPLTLLLPRRS